MNPLHPRRITSLFGNPQSAIRNLLAILLLACTGLFGCGDAGPPPPKIAPVPARMPRISAVASVFPLADIARQTGGRAVDASWWIESGQTTQGFQPSDEQLNRLRIASAVVTGGASESFITDHFDDALVGRRLIRLDSFVPVEASCAQLWLDPAVARDASAAMTDLFVAVAPEFAEPLRETGAAYRRKLDSLLLDWKDPLIGLEGRTVASIGHDYRALARCVGFRLEQIDDDPAIQLQDSDLAAAAKKIRESGALLLLIEHDTPPGVARHIEERLQIPVVLIDSLGSSSSTGNDSYEKLMRYNFKALLDGYQRATRR